MWDTEIGWMYFAFIKQNAEGERHNAEGGKLKQEAKSLFTL
jgi:hypothetical protein